VLEALGIHQISEPGMDHVTSGAQVSDSRTWSADIQLGGDLETVDRINAQPLRQPPTLG